MIALSNIAQGSAVLGMIYLQRKNAAAQEINVPAWVSCWLGVTEPAIFAVNIPRMFPLICGMTGSACAAVICVSTTTTANAIGIFRNIRACNVGGYRRSVYFNRSGW